MRFLVRPESLQGERGVGPEFLRLLSVSLDRFPRSWGSLEQARKLEGAQESLRDAPGAQGRSRSSPELSSASFRKIWFFGPGVHLAASEGPKIAGGASLVRREKPR